MSPTRRDPGRQNGPRTHYPSRFLSGSIGRTNGRVRLWDRTLDRRGRLTSHMVLLGGMMVAMQVELFFGAWTCPGKLSCHVDMVVYASRRYPVYPHFALLRGQPY